MTRKLIDKFRTEAIIDSYFGEMGANFDKFANTYFLDKDIELKEIHTSVILYIESNNKQSNKNQQQTFELISENFLKIWNSTVDFLTTQKKLISQEQLRKDYRLESITIPKSINLKRMVYEMDILNLKDRFSKIIIELENELPFNYSVEG